MVILKLEQNYQLGMASAFWMLGSNIDKVGWPKCGRLIFLSMWGENQIFFTSLHTQDSHGNTINTKNKD
jgi:beta-glucanase (GH16 family)